VDRAPDKIGMWISKPNLLTFVGLAGEVWGGLVRL
jgi:hypothetical protein